MNFEETSMVLATVQVFDNRKVEEKHIIAWQEVLEPHALADCLIAVRDHYRLTDKWIMPSHIIERVREIERRRLDAVKYDIHLNEIDWNQGDWRENTAALHRGIATGMITPEQFEGYANGRTELSALLPTMKAVTR